MTNERSIAVYICGTGNRYSGKTRFDDYEAKDGYKDGYIDLGHSGEMRGSDPKVSSEFLDDSQEFYGYDGSHTLIFGSIEGPVDDMMTRLLEKVGETDKINLVINAHSRGCISAYLLAKRISEDPRLNDKVAVTLDLHDPVPGNLQLTAAMDFFGTTLTGQVRNLTHCKSIVKASIAIDISGGIGMSPLIPTFHQNTDVVIDFIPGSHFAQMTQGKKEADGGAYYERHPNFYMLAMYRSLQLNIEAGVKMIPYKTILERLRWDHDMYAQPQEDFYGASSSSGSSSGTAHSQIIGLIDSIIPDYRNPDLVIKERQFSAFIHEAQRLLYADLLDEHKLKGVQPAVSKKIHGGGRHEAITTVSDATHFNSVHARLDYASHQGRYRSLFGFNNGKAAVELCRPGAYLTSSSVAGSASSSSSVAGSSSSGAYAETSAGSGGIKQTSITLVLPEAPFVMVKRPAEPVPRRGFSLFSSISSISSIESCIEEERPSQAALHESRRNLLLSSLVDQAINATKYSRLDRVGSPLARFQSSQRLSELRYQQLQGILDSKSNSNDKLAQIINLIEDMSFANHGFLKGTTGQFCIDLLSLLKAEPIDANSFLDKLAEYKSLAVLNEQTPTMMTPR